MDVTLAVWAIVALSSSCAAAHVTHAASETEMFAIPVSPNMFNWTYQEFDQQYRFHASLLGKPDLPSWLRYIYSGRHHSGFIFGTPARSSSSAIELEVIGLNRQDYETRKLRISLDVKPREQVARYEVEIKIDNLNVEDLLDRHRMLKLKDIFRSKLWPESKDDLYVTFLASAIDLGARLPLKPNDGEGLVVRLGSSVPFSPELVRLRAEVRPLSKLGSCPRDYKRTSVERLFRDELFSLDWCSFKMYETIVTPKGNELREYQEEPAPRVPGLQKPFAEDPRPWASPRRDQLPTRSYLQEVSLAAVVPVVLMLVAVTALTVVLCSHYAAMRDEESDFFLDNIYHICQEYREHRAQKSDKVELCRYAAEHVNGETHDSISHKSAGVSPNATLARLSSPRSTTNLAASYNRPQPPPYSGSNTTASHHHQRRSEKTTPTCDDAPERPLALEESIKILNEANIDPLTPGSYQPADMVPIVKEQLVAMNPENYTPDGADFSPSYVAKLDVAYVGFKPDYRMNGDSNI